MFLVTFNNDESTIQIYPVSAVVPMLIKVALLEQLYSLRRFYSFQVTSVVRSHSAMCMRVCYYHPLSIIACISIYIFIHRIGRKIQTNNRPSSIVLSKILFQSFDGFWVTLC